MDSVRFLRGAKRVMKKLDTTVVPENDARGVSRFERHFVGILYLGDAVADEQVAQHIVRPSDAQAPRKVCHLEPRNGRGSLFPAPLRRARWLLGGCVVCHHACGAELPGRSLTEKARDSVMESEGWKISGTGKKPSVKASHGAPLDTNLSRFCHQRQNTWASTGPKIV